MTRSIKSTALLAAAVLAFQPLAASAQPAAFFKSMTGSWMNAARNATFSPAQISAASGKEAPKQNDAMLGVFRTETDTGPELWTWRQGDSNLSSAKLRENLADPKTLGLRTLNSLLPKAGAGSWLVIRRPVTRGETRVQTPVFLFTDPDDNEVYFVGIDEEKIYGEGDSRVTLPLTLSRSGDKLMAVYGTPEAGIVEAHRFTPKSGDAILGFFEFQKDAKNQSVLKNATLFGDSDSIAALASQPGMAGTDGIKDLQGNAALLEKMGKVLESGGSFTLTRDKFGNSEFRKHKDAQDKEGSPYIYILEGKVMEIGTE